jgi:hypothetical protein
MTGETLDRNLVGASQLLKLSAGAGSTESELAILSTAEKGTETFSSVNFDIAVPNDQQSPYLSFRPESLSLWLGQTRWT